MKFTPEGGRVAIGAELDGKAGLCITVADTGIGMSAAEIEHALEHFRQVDNSFTKRFEGTGLGLPLARQFAELHGGALSIESQTGEGTAVHVWLPAKRVVIGVAEDLAFEKKASRKGAPAPGGSELKSHGPDMSGPTGYGKLDGVFVRIGVHAPCFDQESKAPILSCSRSSCVGNLPRYICENS